MQALIWKDSEKLMKRYGLPFARTLPVRSAKDARQAVAKLGVPLVLKADLNTPVHKTRLGLVSFAYSKEEAAMAYKGIERKAGSIEAGSRVVAQQFAKGAELIVGGKQDEVFGSIILAGIGGVHVESQKTVAIMLAPVNMRQATDMLKEIGLEAALQGANVRCKERIVAAILVKASRLAAKEKAEFDFNPVIVGNNSAKIVDARIVVTKGR